MQLLKVAVPGEPFQLSRCLVLHWTPWVGCQMLQRVSTPQPTRDFRDNTNPKSLLVDVLFIRGVADALAGPWDVVHLLARRPLGRRGLTAFRTFRHGENRLG